MSDNVEEVHDFSLLQAEDKRRSKSNTARMIVSSGIAALLTGIGIGAAAYGISFAIEPKIIPTERVVVQKEIEKVEIPKVVEKEVVKVVEVPKIIDRPVAAPPPPPPQKPIEAGQRMSREDFQDSDFFKNSSQCKGTLLSHVNGIMVFQNGTKCRDADSNGNLDPSLTTARHNGDLVSCGPNGRTFPNGKPIWSCFALHNGKIESARTDPSVTARRSQPAQQNNDPFADLFEN